MRDIVNTGSPLSSPSGDPLAGITGRVILIDTSGNPIDTWDASTEERYVGTAYFKTDSSGIIWKSDSAYRFKLDESGNKQNLSLWENDKGTATTQYRCEVDYPFIDNFTASVNTGVGALTWAEFMAMGDPLTPVGMGGYYVAHSEVVADDDILLGDIGLGKWVRATLSTLATKLSEFLLSKSTYDPNSNGYVDASRSVVLLIRNTTGATLTKGQPVFVSGATGQTSTVTLAKADAEATSSKTIGLVMDDIANNATGLIVEIGPIYGADTSAFNDGDQLWLSDSVAGGMQTTKPTAPSHSVFLGNVAYAHGTQGVIVANIQNGHELNELHDVNISSLANRDFIWYDSSSLTWKNRALIRKQVTTTAASITHDSANYDFTVLTALDQGLTINLPSGTPTRDMFVGFLIDDSGSGQTLSWSTSIRGYTLAPTSIAAGKTLFAMIRYQTNVAGWHYVGSAET